MFGTQQYVVSIYILAHQTYDRTFQYVRDVTIETGLDRRMYDGTFYRVFNTPWSNNSASLPRSMVSLCPVAELFRESRFPHFGGFWLVVYIATI
jgi:hypothetical protein